MDLEERIEKAEHRLSKVEEELSKHNVTFAVINTKLSAILWGLAVVGSATIGVLIKMILGG